MSKPKHPTSRSLRQGQTLYYIVDDSHALGKRTPARIKQYFMYSHKTKIPLFGQVVRKLSVNGLKKIIEMRYTNTKLWFYSKKKAEAAVREYEMIRPKQRRMRWYKTTEKS